MKLLFLGTSILDFNVSTPFEQPLGGSESALCYLTLSLAKRGHEVTLVSGTSQPGRLSGVTCLSYQGLPHDFWAQSWDAIVVLNGPADVALRLTPHLPDRAFFVLWNMHASDQPAIMGLQDAEARDRWDAIVCVSEWHRRGMVNRFRLDPSRVHVFPNTIGPAFDDMFSSRVELVKAKSIQPILAYTSTPFRGLDVLLNVFPQAHRSYPETTLRVFSSMTVYQQAQADDLYAGLYERSRNAPGVSYVGSLPQPRLAAELKSASILAYPNTFAETDSMAVKEAMAAGLLVVTSDLGAMREATMGFAVLVPHEPSFADRYLAKLEEVLATRARSPEAFVAARFEQMQAINATCSWRIRAREWEEAIRGWRRPKPIVLTSEPDRHDTSAHALPTLAEAREHLQASRFAEAESVCHAILRQTPGEAETHRYLGIAAYSQKRQPEAEACFRQAIACDPNNALAHDQLSLTLRAQGRLQESEAACRQALALQPNLAEAAVNLGSTLSALGRFDEAAEAYRQALRLRPTFAMAENNLGNVLFAQGRPTDSIEAYRRALALQPAYAEAEYNLGNVLHAQGAHDQAIDAFRRALSLRLHYPDAANNLGLALQAKGSPEDAVQAFRAALAQAPEHAAALNNLGNALQGLGQFEEATQALQQALALQPNYAEAAYNLGITLRAQERLDEAIAAYRRALVLSPTFVEARNNLAITLKAQGFLDDAMLEFKKALEIKPTYADAHSNLLYSEQCRPGASLAELARLHREWNQRHAAALKSTWRPFRNTADPDRPIRLGFVSADFKRHPVGFFLVRALECLDPHDFAATCYSVGAKKDDFTARLAAAATTWRDVPHLGDEALAEQIRADEIDVLLELAGHTDGNRLLMFARKPAPIQATWIGYVGTTGLEAMDYLLADRFHILPETESCFREKVLRLPDGYVCYCPPPDAPEVGPLPAAEHGLVTFGSFNNPAKITPGVVAVWADILKQVPDARLVLKYAGLGSDGARRRLRELFAQNGVNPERLDLQGRSPHRAFLNVYNQIDVALDPFPYSGGLTSCEALWMGVPVITYPGETFASRHALSHLSNAGVTGTIARDLDHYIELAVQWANDLPRLAALRAGLREQVRRSPLCDGPRFAENVRRILRHIWTQWCCSETERQDKPIDKTALAIPQPTGTVPDLSEGIQASRRESTLRPTDAKAYIRLGMALHNLGHLDEAVLAFQKALELQPRYAEAHVYAGIVLRKQGRLDEAMASFRRSLELQPSCATTHSQMLMCSQYGPGVTLASLAAAHAEWNLRHAAPFRSSWQPFSNTSDPNRPLRLGFVSADLGPHPVGYFLVRSLEGLASRGCQIFCYADSGSDGRAHGGLTARIAAATTGWREVRSLSDQALAEQIRADRIDILFDMAGHEAGNNRLLVFARKPAPIQVTWLGYNGTTGLAAMDYLLADRFLVPANAEGFFQERILRMPDGYVCFPPLGHAPPFGPLPALTQGHVTLGCFNNPAKITPQVVATWAKILCSLPHARLMLSYRSLDDPGTRQRYLDLFTACGLAEDRLEFLPGAPHNKFLGYYNRIDLALDPFPYSGCTSTCEALWMGVPVITYPGETFASRQSLSHLSNAGVTGTIARDLDHYVELAGQWANDLPRLAALRAELRDKVGRSPLCDGNRFSANLMRALRDIWAQWCAEQTSETTPAKA